MSGSPNEVETEYRGVSWKRNGQKVLWFNEGLGRWIVWRERSDAPPMPPDWEATRAEAAPTGGMLAAASRWRVRAGTRPSRARYRPSGTPIRETSVSPLIRRPGWKSPYRIVPIVLVLAIIILGVIQATTTNPNSIAAERKSAEVLVGRCLQEQGVYKGKEQFNPTIVSCSSRKATVRVITIRPGTPGHPPCPRRTRTIQLPYAGVRYPHLECVVAAHGGT